MTKLDTERKMNRMVSKKDVIIIAKGLNMTPSKKQIATVLKRYEVAAKDDPSGAWYHVIEQLLYEELDSEK